MGNSRNDVDVPMTFKKFVERYLALGENHEKIAKFVDYPGPLDRKCCELTKIQEGVPFK